MIVQSFDLVRAAHQASDRYAVIAMNVIALEHAEAIIAAAEAERAPVILQVSENAANYHGAVEPIIAACRQMAELSTVPVGVHLDHATYRGICERALHAGITSFMYDASTAEWADNLTQTRDYVSWAREHNLGIEAELGVVGGKAGITNAADTMTDPDQAAEFVMETNIDALAIAVGSEHGMANRDRSLDLDRIADVRKRVSIPLVLHGSSGVPFDILTQAMEAGISKINVATQLNVVMTKAIRDYLTRDQDVVDIRKYLTVARSEMTDLVRQYFVTTRSSGKV